MIEHKSLLELSLSKDKSLSCVIEKLVIWDYILVELSLEVQGEGILREDFQNFIILLAEQIPLKRILIKSLITNQTET